MAKQLLHKGTTSKQVAIMIRDSTKNDGSGLTGLTSSSTGLVAYYWRDGSATATAISLTGGTVGTWGAGGQFVEVDSVNLPGVYALSLPDAALATGANWVTVMLKGAANMIVDPLEIQLTDVDVNDGVRFAMTALPNAAAGSTGGLGCTVSLGGTASAGGATTITLTGGSTVDNYYNHQIIQITAGTGVGQANVIIGYVGSTKVATVGRAWKTNPDNTSVFMVKPPIVMSPWNLLEGTASAGGATTITLAGGVATNSYYNGATVFIGAGTGVGQARVITAYVGSTTVATVDRAWTVNPDNTSVFVVLAGDFPATDGAGNLSGSVASVTGAVGSVTAAVDILQTAADKVWSSTSRTLTAFAQSFSDQVWSTTTRTLTAFGFSVTVGTNNDKTGYSLANGSIVAATFASGALGAVWDELLSNHDVLGSFGQRLQAVRTGTAQTGSTNTTLKLDSGASATDHTYEQSLAFITGGTGIGQANFITGYVGSTKVATVQETWIVTPDNTSQFIILPWDAVTKVVGAVGSVTGNVGGNVVGSVASVTNAVDILQSAADKVWASTARTLTAFAQAFSDQVWSTAARTLTAFGFSVTVGTNNDKTGYSLANGSIAAATFAAGALGAVWDESLASHTTSGTFGQALQPVRTGTAQAGASTSITLDAGASAIDNFYNNGLLFITGGTGQHQARFIIGYVGVTKVATVSSAWATNPDSSSIFEIIPFDSISVPSVPTAAQNAAAVWNEPRSSHTTAGTFGEGVAAVEGNVTGSVNNVVTAVTVGTNNDKTGYSLAANAVDAAQFTQAAADKVWTSAARTLTAFAQSFADQVWTSASRTLTAFAQGFSDQTWASATRTLTSFGALVADTATAVWAAATRTLTAFGFSVTVGTNLDKSGYSLTVAPPTAAQIDTQLSGTHGSGQWGGGSAGAGVNSVTLTVQNTGATPLSGISVTIKDALQTTVLALGVTNGAGQVVFNLNNGTYTVLIISSPAYTSPAPQTLVVSGTTTATYTLAAFNPGTPASASLCRIFGTLRKLDGTAAANVNVSFELRPTTAYKANDTAIVVKEADVQTDVNGFFFADLTRSSQFTPITGTVGTSYVIYASDAQLHHSFVAPDASSADIFSLTLTAV